MPYRSCRVLPPAPIQIAQCGPSISPLPQRATEGAELIVAHGAPHLEDADARQEKEAVIDQLHGGIRKLIGHRGHGRQFESSLVDGLDRFLERRRLADAHLVHKALHFFQCAAARLLAARHQTVTSQRQIELIAIPIGKRQAIEQVADCRTIAGNT